LILFSARNCACGFEFYGFGQRPTSIKIKRQAEAAALNFRKRVILLLCLLIVAPTVSAPFGYADSKENQHGYDGMTAVIHTPLAVICRHDL